MGIEAVSEFVAIVLALSLATERLVIIIRTPPTFLGFIPLGKWLNDENPDPQKDGPRRLVLQILSFVCAVFTSGWLATNGGWNPFDSIKIGSQTIPLLILALLATGGSSFWKNILGYTKAVRGIRTREDESQRVKIHRAKKLRHSVQRMEEVLKEIEAKGQPSL